jgi:hypothetical protein
LNFIDVLSGLTRDRWYRSELIRVLCSGPGAASLYFSAFCGSLCLMLSFAFVKEMETASMVVFLVMLILSSSFIIFDLGSTSGTTAWNCYGEQAGAASAE